MQKGAWALVLGLTGLIGLLVYAVAPEKKTIDLEILAEGLDHPWGLAFMPDGGFIVTERPGNMWLFNDLGEKTAIKGLPEIWVDSQGGLLDIAVRDEWIYFSFSEPGKGKTSSTAVARARLQGDKLTDLSVIFSQQPKKVSHAHFGSRLMFSNSGHLFITLGDRKFFRDDAQTLDNHHGKVIRIWPDGRVPEDNPFVDQEQALPEIWSFGHRNMQGAVFNPDNGNLWVHEHGPKGGDEINIVEPGNNYGWPVITYGEEYRGGAIGEGTHKPGLEQPLYYWVPSIAPSGMTFYTGTKYPQWKGNLFVGSLKFQQLVRLTVKGGRIIEEERLLKDELGERIRTVLQGPDHLLYLLTDEDNGKIVRIKAFQ